MSFTYRGLKADLKRYLVTEEDVQKQIEGILEENPKIEHVTDRPAQLGDEVIIDYAGFCDGEQFEGGTAQHQPLTLGSGTFIPGFEEQLVGKEIGEEVIVSVTFPEAYHSEELAGQPVVFTVTVNSIGELVKPELTDEYVQSLGMDYCQNVEEFYDVVRQSLEDSANATLENELQTQVIEKLMEIYKIKRALKK